MSDEGKDTNDIKTALGQKLWKMLSDPPYNYTIPKNLRKILESCGYNRLCSFLKFDDKSIENLQNFMRQKLPGILKKKGENGKNKLLPVFEDGNETSLLITEVEALFGLPIHYTDANNLSITDRRKLLGRAWCVPVITQILKPLAEELKLSKS